MWKFTEGGGPSDVIACQRFGTNSSCHTCFKPTRFLPLQPRVAIFCTCQSHFANERGVRAGKLRSSSPCFVRILFFDQSMCLVSFASLDVISVFGCKYHSDLLPTPRFRFLLVHHYKTRICPALVSATTSKTAEKHCRVPTKRKEQRRACFSVAASLRHRRTRRPKPVTVLEVFRGIFFPWVVEPYSITHRWQEYVMNSLDRPAPVTLNECNIDSTPPPFLVL